MSAGESSDNIFPLKIQSRLNFWAKLQKGRTDETQTEYESNGGTSPRTKTRKPAR